MAIVKNSGGTIAHHVSDCVHQAAGSEEGGGECHQEGHVHNAPEGHLEIRHECDAHGNKQDVQDDAHEV